MIQEDHIYDYAIIGKKLFEDTKLRALGPLEYFYERTTSIFGAVGHNVPSPVNKATIGLIMKWPLGSKPDANADVLFDMSPHAPTHWIDELPRTVVAMKMYYTSVGVYLGCLRNATLQQIRHVLHFVLDECGFNLVGFDAMGLTLPTEAAGKPNPDWAKLLWAIECCHRAGAEVCLEPLLRRDIFQGSNTNEFVVNRILGFQEDDVARPKWGLPNADRDPIGRITPASGFPGKAGCAIAAQLSFNAAHFDARLKRGYRIAANFANPEVRAWFNNQAARAAELAEQRAAEMRPQPGPVQERS